MLLKVNKQLILENLDPTLVVGGLGAIALGAGAYNTLKQPSQPSQPPQQYSFKYATPDDIEKNKEAYSNYTKTYLPEYGPKDLENDPVLMDHKNNEVLGVFDHQMSNSHNYLEPYGIHPDAKRVSEALSQTASNLTPNDEMEVYLDKKYVDKNKDLFKNHDIDPISRYAGNTTLTFNKGMRDGKKV